LVFRFFHRVGKKSLRKILGILRVFEYFGLFSEGFLIIFLHCDEPCLGRSRKTFE
jgi:hypothetical protein